MEALVWPYPTSLSFGSHLPRMGYFFLNQDIYYKIHRSIAIFDKNRYLDHLDTTFWASGIYRYQSGNLGTPPVGKFSQSIPRDSLRWLPSDDRYSKEEYTFCDIIDLRLKDDMEKTLRRNKTNKLFLSQYLGVVGHDIRVTRAVYLGKLGR